MGVHGHMMRESCDFDWCRAAHEEESNVSEKGGGWGGVVGARAPAIGKGGVRQSQRAKDKTLEEQSLLPFLHYRSSCLVYINFHVVMSTIHTIILVKLHDPPPPSTLKSRNPSHIPPPSSSLPSQPHITLNLPSKHPHPSQPTHTFPTSRPTSSHTYPHPLSFTKPATATPTGHAELVSS